MKRIKFWDKTLKQLGFPDKWKRNNKMRRWENKDEYFDFYAYAKNTKTWSIFSSREYCYITDKMLYEKGYK